MRSLTVHWIPTDPKTKGGASGEAAPDGVNMLFGSCRLRLQLSLLMLFAGATAAVAQTPIISGSVYNLVSKTSSLTIDNGGSTTSGTALEQNSATAGNTNQQWRINSLGGGNYQLINLSIGMALDTGGSAVNGALVVQNVSSSTPIVSQGWSINSAGNGYYQLLSASSGMALDNGGSTTAGGSILQAVPVSGDANQLWQLVPVQIGANTPFTSYEAESGILAGGATVVSLTSAPTTELSSPQLEASGHAYVNLGATGQSVSWTNNTGENITFVNLRYSIPDSSGGGGITSTLDLYVNGVFRQVLNVNSIQTWVYETSSTYDGMSQSPSTGSPHVFWDETNAFIVGAAVAPGSTITIVKDAANTAAYYNIDVIDLEAPPAALTQPANTLSITTNCGAVANNINSDSTSAIQSCINQAESSGQAVWIPAGIFYLNTSRGLTMKGITVEGAGMWYSTVYYNVPLPAASTSNPFFATSVTLKNFTIDGDAVSNNTVGGNGGAIYMNGTNWLIDSLWVRHEGAGIWASGTNGTVQNCRLNNTWADGININNGNGGTGYTVGNNLIVQNNFIRGSGDDGLAINDSNDNPATQQEMLNPTVLNNTVVAPWWANLIGVYGGADVLVANNLVHDSVKLYGIFIGGYDSTGKGAPLETARVQGNTVIRGGSYGYANRNAGIGVGETETASANGEPAMTNMYVLGNTVLNAMFDGVDVVGGTGTEINNNTVDSPGKGGFIIQSNAVGNASFLCNTVTNLASGQLAYANQASGFPAGGSCNNGFTASSGLTIPKVALSLSPSSITGTQSLTVTIALSGGAGNPIPTGSVIVTSGSYTSASTVLNAKGIATVTVSAAIFGIGTDTLLATYTPDSTSSTFYASSSSTASIYVNPSFALSNSGAITVFPGVTAGNSGTITVTSSGFSGTVALACAVTTTVANPTDIPTCTITPLVTLTGTGTATATLTINTTAAAANVLPAKGLLAPAEGAAMPAVLFSLVLPIRRRRWKAAFVLLFLIASGMCLGCSSSSISSGRGSSPGTTLGAYTVTVTGTVGTTTQSTVVSLTVD